jgi:hypothetical protein
VARKSGFQRKDGLLVHRTAMGGGYSFEPAIQAVRHLPQHQGVHRTCPLI